MHECLPVCLPALCLLAYLPLGLPPILYRRSAYDAESISFTWDAEEKENTADSGT